MAAIVFETFEIELQNTLYNLYDPIYVPEPCVFEVFDIPASQGLDALRNPIITAIEEVMGNRHVPETAKTHILYRILDTRFVQAYSQEKAADILGLSTRHLRRKQNEAVHALAVRVWNRHLLSNSENINEQTIPAERSTPENAAEAPQVSDSIAKAEAAWGDTVLQEIEALNEHSPGVTTDPGKVIYKAVEMVGFLRKKDVILLEALDIPTGLEISIHPSVLRQVILYIIDQIVQTGYSGKIQLLLKSDEESVTISFRIGAPAVGEPDPDFPHVQQLAAILGVKTVLHQIDNGFSIDLIFGKSQKILVVVVDDNAEIAHLYRRFVMDTRFKILHLSHGIDLLEQIGSLKPEILVIDVMLPDMDGWDLLLQLRQNPEAEHIPVVICSVMGNEKVARSLGATAYLPKPVERKAFIQILDKISETM